VEEEVDAGEIIVQKKVAVDPSDTPETLKDKVQALEKKWYPEVIRWFAEGKIK
jgi:phosphoribosylglycinamide formyltransferase-1